MNKMFSIAIAILLIAGLVWFFYPSDKVSAPSRTPQVETELTKPSVTQTPPAQVENKAVFTILGKNFSYDVKEIKVTEGDTVTIHFESAEGLHDWKLDEFTVATKQVEPGTRTSVTFVADKAGEFEYYCSIGQHRAMGMVGKLIVEAKQ